MKGADRYTARIDVMARRLGDETVILDLASGTYFGLDAIGTRIWDLLQEGRCVDEVSAAIAAEFEAPVAEVRADLEELLEALVQRALVEPR